MHRPHLRRPALAATSLLAALALGVAGGPAAQASAGTAGPAPTDQTHSGRLSAHHALPQPRHGASPRAGEPAVHNPLLKQILGSTDPDIAPEPPGLSALCQGFIGQPNPYANPAPNVDQIVGDGTVPAGAGSQSGCSTAQDETSIATNPYNPRNIVAGANDYRVFNSRENRADGSGWAYTSFDGGHSWTNVQLPHLTFQTGGTGPFHYFDAAGDPTLAFGPLNTVYYGNIVFSRAAPTAPGGTEPATAIVVNVSHDGGLHWSEPIIVALDGVDLAGNPTPTRIFNDKIWVTADKFSGRVYVSWTRFEDNPDGSRLDSPIAVSASTDFGQTFSPRHQVSPSLTGFTGGITPFSQGSNPQVGNDGTLYIAYESAVCATLACTSPTDHDATVVATSHDHGVTFSQAEVDVNFDFPFNPDVGRSTLTGENFRINSYPQLTYDPVFNRLYVVWNDDRNGLYDAQTGASIKTNGDNIVSSSGDGAHWTAPTVVGTGQDEVFGAVAAFAGVVAVSSYTRHYDPNGINLDYAYWKSFGVNDLAGARIHRITTQSSNPQIQFVAVGLQSGQVLQGVFIGDYSAMSMGFDFKIHPCWTDFRGRPGVTDPNQDVYTQGISLF